MFYQFHWLISDMTMTQLTQSSSSFFSMNLFVPKVANMKYQLEPTKVGSWITSWS